MREFPDKESKRKWLAVIIGYYKINREFEGTVRQMVRLIFNVTDKKEIQTIRSTCSYLRDRNVLIVVGKVGRSNIYGITRDQLKMWAAEESAELAPEDPVVLTSDDERKALLSSVFLRHAS